MNRRNQPQALWRLVLAASTFVVLVACAPSGDTAVPASTQTSPPAATASPTASPNVADTPTPTPQPTPTYPPSPIQPSPTAASAAGESPTPLPTQTHLMSPIQPSATASPFGSGTPVYSYRIILEFPHDPLAWTQGLVIQDGVLYEGTGQLGKSTLRRVDIESGEVQQVHALPETLYGEGVAVVGDKIVQLTWRDHTGLVYDRESFEVLHTFSYPTEGWGLAFDGQKLIMSDGSANLYFLDPSTYEQTSQVEVYDERGPLTRLNELEFVEGEIWANVWYQDVIARIDPLTGKVAGWIDLRGLRHTGGTTLPGDVLNGIAYDAGSGRLFVTGKLWPKLFEIEVLPPEEQQ